MILVWGRQPIHGRASSRRACGERRRDLSHRREQLGDASIRHRLWSGARRLDRIREPACRNRRYGGAYIRPGEPPSGAAHSAAVAMLAVASSLRGLVINRPAAGRSNASKPYQLDLIAKAGFQVPDTLVTTDPGAGRSFLREHGRLVYKSLSGIRSIIATLDSSNEARLDDVRTGPCNTKVYCGS